MVQPASPERGSDPHVDLSRVQEMLEGVLRAIDLHEIEATAAQRGHISGAIAALRVLTATRD